MSDRRGGGARFGRAIVQAILDEIAERLQRIGVVGGSAIDASHLVGATPAGVAKTVVQHNGVEVAVIGTLNFSGPSWVVTYDAVLGRVNVSLASGGLEPRDIVDRSGTSVTDRASSPDDILVTRPV